MYDDLTDEQRVELALEFKARGLEIPLKLKALLGDEDTRLIEGLWHELEE